MGRNGGVLAVYRGFSSQCFGTLPGEVLYFGTYHNVKQMLLDNPIGQNTPSAAYTAANLLAECMWVVGASPGSRVSQIMRLQTHLRGDPAMWLESWAVAKGIVQHEGWRGLWRGSLAMFAYSMPNSTVWWNVYEHSKTALAAEAPRSWGAEHPAVLAAAGTVAAVVATVSTNPLDVIRTRMQCIPVPVPAYTVLRQVVQDRALFLGVIPRLAAALPRAVAMCIFYENAVAYCEN